MTESSIKISNGNSDIRYILEIYLEFPNQFGNSHNELLFFARGGNNSFIICTKAKKIKNVVHIRILQHSFKLKTVHNVIEFDPSSWLKPYIELSTELREKAKKKFE